MLDTKLNKVIKKKSKTTNKGKYINRKLKEKKKKNKNIKNKYYRGEGKVININKKISIERKRTKKLKNTRKISKYNTANIKVTKKKFKQDGGNSNSTTTTTYNRNVEPTTPLRDYLRFGDQLDQNVERMDLGPKWPGKPPYPPDCCIM